MIQVDLDHCLKVAMDAVSTAAKTVLEGFEESTKVVNSKTASYDLVTEYDKKTEVFLISTLSEAFPDHKFIGEETASKLKLTNVPTWIIDPIDGTTNFVHGFPYCGICVGLAVEKEMVLGIVCSPPLNQTFSAVKGRGAFLNGKPIHTSGIEELTDAVVGQELSLGARPELTDIFVKRYRTCVTQVQGVRCIGSAEMSLCQVAMGTLDAFQAEYLYPWDLAAGSIIITEAGGAVLDIDGGKFDCEKGCIIAASSQKLADSLAEIFKSD